MADRLSDDEPDNLIVLVLDRVNRNYSNLFSEFNILEVASNHSLDWKKKLVIPILPDGMTNEDITGILSIYGRIESCDITISDRGLTCAHVKFEEYNNAVRAFKAANENKIQFNGTPIYFIKPDEKVEEQEGSQMETEDDKSEKIDFFNRLNDDCLEEIFSKLSNLDRLSSSGVCLRWQEVINEMWTKVRDLSIPTLFTEEYDGEESAWSNKKWISNVKKGILHIIMQYGCYLTRLEIVVNSIFFRCRSVNFSTLIENHCKNIEVLVVRLSFSSKYQFFTNMSPLVEFYSTMLKKLEKLTVLKIDLLCLDRDEWTAICNKTSLVSLTLTGCRIGGPINEICKLCNLKYLNIAELYDLNLNDEFCVDLSNHCTNLEYLNISGSFCIKDVGIKAIGRLPNLKVLVADHMKQITDENVIYLRQLEELHCRNNASITTRGICNFISMAHNLKVLNVFECPLVTEEILEYANSRVTDKTNEIPLRIIHESTAITACSTRK